MQTDSTISPQDNLTVSDEKLCKNIKSIDNISYDSDKKMFNFDDTDQIAVNNNVLLRYNMTDDMKPVYDKSIPTDKEEYWSNVYFSTLSPTKGTVQIGSRNLNASLFISRGTILEPICVNPEQTETYVFHQGSTTRDFLCYKTQNENTYICVDISDGNYFLLDKFWYVMVTNRYTHPENIPTDWGHAQLSIEYTDMSSLLVNTAGIYYKDNMLNKTYAKTWVNM